MKTDFTEKKKKSGKKKYKALVIILLFFIAVRIALPYVILHFANKSLAGINGYYGKIRDIDLALYRGAYKIKDIYIHKKDSVTQFETEFFDSEVIDLSIEWKALLDGAIVGSVDVQSPSLIFTKDKVEPKEVVEDSTDFRVMLDNFMPLSINHFSVKQGTIRYNDHTSNPKVKVELNSLYVLAENLTNVKGGSLLPSTITTSANIYGGKLNLNMRLNLLEKDPTFDMNAEVDNIDLPSLNDFFKAYAKIDVNSGTFGLFMEAAAKGGAFEGYIKPLIKNLDVLGPEDKEDNIFRKFWEGAVGGVGVIFRNQKKDQVGTKIPLEGTFEKTKVRVMVAIVEVLRNAFIEALRPSVDNEINLSSVGDENVKKGPLKDMFKEKEKDKKAAEQTNDPGHSEEKKSNEAKEKKKGIFKGLFNKKDKQKENENKSDEGK